MNTALGLLPTPQADIHVRTPGFSRSRLHLTTFDEEPLVALDFLKTNKIDAAFLDIEMPDMDGIELSNRVIDLQGRIAVVFVTAYNQYAVEAFRLNALDYLMKPVTADRLQETLNRIVEEREIRMHPTEVQIRCFGKFRVTNGSGEVKFRTEKAEELLAFLIDRRGNFVNRNEIIDCLWEEYDGDRALIHFHTTLHYLKKALLQQGVAVPIEHERGSYRTATPSRFPGRDRVNHVNKRLSFEVGPELGALPYP